MGNIVNRVFESAGPDGKVRGTPQQIIDKYQVLARDAQVSGDRVAAEDYLQHAEHYTRLLGEAQRQTQENRQAQESRQDGRDDTRSDAETRGEATSREGEETIAERPQAPRSDQPQNVQPQPQEAGGLATFGSDEPAADTGPVETPETSRQQSASAAAPEPQQAQERASRAAEGEQPDSSKPAPAAAEAAPPTPPKRTRRRKPTTQEAAEASAE